MVLPMLSLALTVAAASLPGGPATVLIAPGVHMPRLNLGTCCGSDPTPRDANQALVADIDGLADGMVFSVRSPTRP